MKKVEHNGRSVDFFLLNGKVVKIDDSTTTEVSGYGGGSYMTMEGSLAIRPITISSQTCYEREVWVKDSEGKEQSLMLNDKSIKLREGNEVTLGLTKSSSSRRLVSIRNHTTDKQYSLSSDAGIVKAYQLATEAKFMELVLWLFFAAICGILTLSAAGFFFARTSFGRYLFNGPLGEIVSWLAFGVTGAVFVWVFWVGIKKFSRAQKSFEEAVAKISACRRELLS